MSLVPIPPPGLADLTLDELAALAAREWHSTNQQLVGALGHFIRLGDILLTARTRIDDGNWIEWLRTIGIEHHFTAARAMRLAHYQDHLPPEAFQVWRDAGGRVLNPSWNRALTYVRGLPDANPKGHHGGGLPKHVRTEIQRLIKDGIPQRQIAAMLNVSQTTVHRIANPHLSAAKKERDKAARRERTAAARALREQRQREERDGLAKATGGELAEAYSLIRRTLAVIDKAGRATSGQTRAYAHEVAIHATRAEAAIVNALQAARGTPG